MNIVISGQAMDMLPGLEEKLMADLLTEGTREYFKLDPAKRIAAKGLVAVPLLVWMENHTRQQVEKLHGKEAGKEAGRAVRCPRGDDPNLHLAKLFSEILLRAMKHATLTIDADSGTITDFHLDLKSPGEAGRQLDSDRHQGIREVNGAQIP